MSTNENKLENCRWCGAQASHNINVGDGMHSSVGCLNRRCKMPSVVYTDYGNEKEEAIQEWNRRQL